MTSRTLLNEFAENFMHQFDGMVIGEVKDPFLGSDPIEGHMDQKYEWAFSETLGRLDTKAAGLLTHISMMIAIAALSVSSSDTHWLEVTVISFQMTLYLFFAMCCLRALAFRDVIQPKNPEKLSSMGFFHDYQNRMKVLICAEYVNFVTRWVFLLTFVFSLTLIAHLIL